MSTGKLIVKKEDFELLLKSQIESGSLKLKVVIIYLIVKLVKTKQLSYSQEELYE